MKYCPYCGAENKDESLYCVSCGKPLTRESSASHNDDTEYIKDEEDSYFDDSKWDDQTKSAWDESSYIDDSYNAKSQGNDMRKLEITKIILLAVLIVVVIGGGLFFYTNMKSGTKSDTKTSETKSSSSSSKSSDSDDSSAEISSDSQSTGDSSSSSDTSATDQSTPDTSSTDDSTSTSSSDYVLPDSSTSYISDSELSGLSKDDLAIARNEIYARHGYIFHKNMAMKKYFESKSWYHPVTSDQDSISLNQYEKANIEKIQGYEKQD